MKGYRLTIPGKPQLYKPGKIEYKPKPHILPHPEIVDFRERVREAISAMYNEGFVFDYPVELEIEFYHPTKRMISVAGCTQALVAALSPHLLTHTGYAKQIVSKTGYDKENPRTEVTIRPLM